MVSEALITLFPAAGVRARAGNLELLGAPVELEGVEALRVRLEEGGAGEASVS